MTTYGDGFGQVYSRPVNVKDESNDIRTEKVIEVKMNGANVKVTLRDKIVSWDPYLNLVKASAYTWRMAAQNKGRPYFPVPPIKRRIKDALIKVTVEI